MKGKMSETEKYFLNILNQKMKNIGFIKRKRNKIGTEVGRTKQKNKKDKFRG